MDLLTSSGGDEKQAATDFSISNPPEMGQKYQILLQTFNSSPFRALEMEI